MRSVTIIILHVFLLPGLAKDLEVSRTMRMSEDQVDKLVDKLIDKLLGVSSTPNLAKTRASTPSLNGLNRAQILASLPGPSALKNQVFSAIQANNGRCVSMKASSEAAEAAEWIAKFKERQGLPSGSGAAPVSLEPLSKEAVQDMAGVTAPLGFFDPMGISTNVPEGQLMFYREAELKHGRVCMIAILGLLVAEKGAFIPLLGEGIPSGTPAFLLGTPFVHDFPLDSFWKVALTAVAFEEFRRALNIDMGRISMTSKVAPGDYGWDPLGMKPKDPTALKELQNKELNNGRLAMFAAAGIIAQEQVTNSNILPR